MHTVVFALNCRREAFHVPRGSCSARVLRRAACCMHLYGAPRWRAAARGFARIRAAARGAQGRAPPASITEQSLLVWCVLHVRNMCVHMSCADLKCASTCQHMCEHMSCAKVTGACAGNIPNPRFSLKSKCPDSLSYFSTKAGGTNSLISFKPHGAPIFTIKIDAGKFCS